MSTDADIIKITKKLEDMIKCEPKNDSNIVDLLKLLDEVPLTLDTLKKTRVGMSVNLLRKQTTSPEVANYSKILIKRWKKLLNDQTSNKGFKNDDSNKFIDSPSNSQEPIFENTNDPIRLKCQELLLKALTPENEGELSLNVDFKYMAMKIEDSIYKEFSNTDFKYKSRIRSKVSNLKDTKNPNLKINVLLGNITPDRFAKMTSEEMASEEMKKLRQKYTKEAINDHQISTLTGTPTDLFKCGKCKGKNCTYTQVQTRSADEPMTTFVFCIDCGNRWKF